MATVRAMLSKERRKKCGGYALVIQIIHRRAKKVIYTPYTLKENEFDPIAEKAVYINSIRFTRKQVREINEYLADHKQEIAEILVKLAEQERKYTVDDIIKKYKEKHCKYFLSTFIQRLIERKILLDKMGTAKALRSTLRSLERYLDKREVAFSEIDRTFVKSYENFLYDEGVQENTVCFYMRNFRAIYNMAHDSGIEMSNENPFSKIHIRNCKTIKRALKKEVIEKIAMIQLSTPDLDDARNLFMFSFYTRGMSFVDIIHLQHSDIVDGVLSYKRQKTHQNIRVKVTPALQKLIDKYHTDSMYILPFITRMQHSTLYEKYQAAYASLYRNLKRIQKMIGLTTPLTFHVARHSWATIAKEQGASTIEISEGLGHTTEKITAVYLKELDCSVIDRLNDRIIKFSMQKRHQ